MWEMKRFCFDVVTHTEEKEPKVICNYVFFNLLLHVRSNSQWHKVVSVDYKLDFAFSIVELLDFAPEDKLNTVRVSFDKGITQLRVRLAITLKTLRGTFVAWDE